MSDELLMKILKIDNGIGLFRTKNDGEWVPIDKIDKAGLLKLLDLFIEHDVEMDSTEDCELHNKAQEIIYSSILEKFENLGRNKSKFKDESARTYLEAIQKYSQVDE